MTLKTRPFYFFIHIPKTAGTTLRSIVDLQMGHKNVLTYYNQPNRSLLDNLDALVSTNSHYQALIGHFQFGVHQNIGREAQYFTFLRDPVDLTISAYYERLKTGRSEFEKPDGSIMSIIEHIDANLFGYTNLQTRIVAGIDGKEVLTEEDLDLAKENIEKYYKFVGISEMFDQSILLLSKILGWRPCIYGTLNKGPDSKEIGDDVRDAIVKITPFDKELYDFARKRLEQSIADIEEAFISAFSELEASDVSLNQQAEFIDLPSVEKLITG
jgi:hypothetical protein